MSRVARGFHHRHCGRAERLGAGQMDARGFSDEVGGGDIEFSRSISRASPEANRRYVRNHRGASLPTPPNHDGIEDSFVEKVSVVRYWADSRWIEFQGSVAPLPNPALLLLSDSMLL